MTDLIIIAVCMLAGIAAGLFIGAALKDNYPRWVVAMSVFAASFTTAVVVGVCLSMAFKV